MFKMKLLSDNSEVVSYNFSHFPIYAKQTSLSKYPAMAAANHCHNDWEFILILNGKMPHSMNGQSYELHIMSIFHSLCYNLYHNMKHNVPYTETTDDKKLYAMHIMIGYIQKNYQGKVTLDEIARAGNVCRSSCCNIFQLILNKSPISYLTEYRLEKSIELLNITSISITEIALQCGFTGSSYFTEIFHKNLGCTPSQYRKKIFNIS